MIPKPVYPHISALKIPAKRAANGPGKTKILKMVTKKLQKVLTSVTIRDIICP